MGIKLKLNVQEIENHKFNNVPRGYDALEVDKFLDEIIKDYLKIEQEELVSRKELDDARVLIEKLKQENDKLRLENSKLSAKIPNLKNENVNVDNIQILQRINALERYLYKKGIDPKNIK